MQVKQTKKHLRSEAASLILGDARPPSLSMDKPFVHVAVSLPLYTHLSICPSIYRRNLDGHHSPKHLLGQHFPSKGELVEFSLRGKLFPLRDHFPLRIAFTFPQNGLFSQEMKGLGK